MNLPTKIKVLSLTFDCVDLLPGEQLEARGNVRYREQRIGIDPLSKSERWLLTLWHEIWHAATDQLDIQQDSEEAMAKFAAMVIHEALIDNPELVEIYHRLHTEETDMGSTKG